MKFKLDENFGARTQHIFETSGHDVQTVRQEALQGASDIRLFEVCVREQRCLVTLDLDFADVTRFRSIRTAGIVVIRVARNPSLPLLESLIRQLLTALERMPTAAASWSWPARWTSWPATRTVLRPTRSKYRPAFSPRNRRRRLSIVETYGMLWHVSNVFWQRYQWR